MFDVFEQRIDDERTADHFYGFFEAGDNSIGIIFYAEVGGKISADHLAADDSAEIHSQGEEEKQFEFVFEVQEIHQVGDAEQDNGSYARDDPCKIETPSEPKTARIGLMSCS